MPIKKRKPLGRVAPVSPTVWQILTDQEPVLDTESAEWDWIECAWPMRSDPPAEPLLKAWDAARDEVIAWAAEHTPGRRPSIWWLLDAPGPRHRIGGRGTAYADAFQVEPQSLFGIPTAWCSTVDVACHAAGEGGIHAPRLGVTVEAVDPADPPVFEAQAAFLERHGLLQPGERERLEPADFEPEHVELDARGRTLFRPAV
jgi:hypothetical protein